MDTWAALAQKSLLFTIHWSQLASGPKIRQGELRNMRSTCVSGEAIRLLQNHVV